MCSSLSFKSLTYLRIKEQGFFFRQTSGYCDRSYYCFKLRPSLQSVRSPSLFLLAATLTSLIDLWCHFVQSPSKLFRDLVTWPSALSTQFDTQCQRIPGNWRAFLSSCQHSHIKTDHRTFNSPEKSGKCWLSVRKTAVLEFVVYIWRLCWFALEKCMVSMILVQGRNQ